MFKATVGTVLKGLRAVGFEYCVQEEYIYVCGGGTGRTLKNTWKDTNMKIPYCTILY